MVPKIWHLFPVLCLAAVGTATAEHITSADAYRLATEFADSRGISLKTVPRRAPGKNSDKATPFYVFNSQGEKGYVIVSGDDRTEAILGYTDSGSYDPGNLPDNLRYWLDYYSYEISRLDETAAEAPARAKSAATAPRRARYARMEPLLSCQWNQDGPYWNECPVLDNRRCYTGCVATATAQVMYYHKWPQDPTTSIPALTFSYNNVTYQLQELPSVTFDWNNMLGNYSNGYNDTQATAVARLMRYVGQGAKSGYGPDGTGAGFTEIVNSLRNYFGYDRNCRQLYRVNYSSDEAWEEMIYNELTTNGPVAYAGTSNGGAHAFVCDGYDGEGRFHINWGWGGYCDGYYVLSVLRPEGSGIGGSTTADGYCQWMEIIAGVKRPADYLKAEVPVITFYRDQNYQGSGVGLGEGEYRLSDMMAYGLLNDDISSVKITPGFKALVYTDDNFGGSVTELASDAWGLSATYNDNISSIKIMPNGKSGIDGFYKIRNKNSGKYLDLDNNSTDNNTAVIQFDNEINDPTQTWAFTEVETGVYRIGALSNQRNGLDVRDGNRAESAQVHLYEYVGGRNQQFILFDKGSGSYQFVDRNSGNVVEMPGSATGNGEWIKTWRNNGTDTQIWTLEENKAEGALTATMYVDDRYNGKAVSVSEGEYNTLRMNIFNIKDNDMTSLRVAPGFKVTVYDGDNFSGDSHTYTADNANVGGFNDRMSSFRVEPNGKPGMAGNFRIRNRNSGKYLDTADDKTANDTPVMQISDQGDHPSQTWTFAAVNNANGVYRIGTFTAPDQGFDVADVKTDNGTQVKIYTYSGGANQQFIVYDKGDGYYQLIDRNSGKAVEVPGSSHTEGEWIKIYDNNGSDTQQWAIEENCITGEAIATIYRDADYKGKSVALAEGDYDTSRLKRYNFRDNDLSSLKVTPGFKVIVYDGDSFTGNSREIKATSNYVGADWNDKVSSLRVVPNGVTGHGGDFYLRNRNSGQYLDIDNNSTDNGTHVIQYHFEDHSSQIWKLSEVESGVYRIAASGDNSKVLDVKDAGTANGTEIQLYTHTGAAHQQFILYAIGDNYQLVSRHSGRVVEVPESSHEPGEWVRLYGNNGTNTQQWILVDPSVMTTVESLASDAGGLVLRGRTILATALGGQMLEIYSLSGQKLLSTSLESDNESVVLSDLAPGFYIATAGNCRIKMRLP